MSNGSELDAPRVRRLLGVEAPDAGPAQPLPTIAPGISIRPGAKIALPSESSPPAGAIPLDRLVQQLISASAVNTLVLTIDTMPGSQLRLSGIGIGLFDPASIGLMSWTLLYNDKVVHDYVNVSAGLGSLQQPTAIFYHASGPATTKVVVTNSDTIKARTFLVRALGWTYADVATSA